MKKSLIYNKYNSFSIDLSNLLLILDDLNIKIKDIKQISNGWKNISFVAKLKNNKKIFVKCFKDETYLLNEVNKYKKINNYIKTPKLFFVINNNMNILIYEYIENSISFNNINPNTDKNIDIFIKEIAITLANIHNIRDEKQKLEIPQFKNWYSIFLKNEKVNDIIGNDRLIKILKIQNNYKNEIIEIENYLSFCHCDFKSSNILIKNNKIIIVDWEFSSYCYSFLDIGQLFREKEIYMSNRCISIFEKNYNKIIQNNKLPKNWTIHIKLIDMGNLLEMLSRQEKDSIQIKNIISLIDNYLDYLL